ncbi:MULTISPECIES: hypothetical protein [Psychrilyobacter]|uniref:Uncharacterized protein n=2 Tax=Psychrilyobacter TaxID=623282 RepID=A0ABX9KFE2_9FUSO|nr:MULTISPECIES: hypothetical protein [Psychrilyobacter]NDI78503.1 hypothetical protein [Psychrilyobacter piezotolerans]RDE60486.1 hypothetical protein DV867_10910 [Psychrilyobacter sp. S5]REI40516.1 hypothetical protein DYH56_10910 [Psychrilyobacter piezotolerans]
MSKSLDKFHDELNKLEKLLLPLYSDHGELFEYLDSINSSRDVHEKMRSINKIQKYCESQSNVIDRDILNRIDHLKDLLR